MPFSRDGVWTQPIEGDHQAFKSKILSKPQEIAPTPEMIQAISANIAPAAIRDDVYSTIGKLKPEVDIVIPVYGGLHVLKPCIESIKRNTHWRFNLIIVDDCSPDPAVHDYLIGLEISSDLPVTVLWNKRNRGFAAAVNRGVAQGKAPYICILNSDTLVTDGWLVRQLMALEADDRNAIVNPATNNTALVNVGMYAGKSYRDMAYAMAHSANTPTHNEIMPTGFCFTVRRSLWDEVGPFDEAYVSYGEETDFWFKALKFSDPGTGILKKYRSVIADNAYVFHERGTSFSQLGDDQHMGLRRSGSQRFNEVHRDFAEWRQGFNPDEAVRHLRHELAADTFPKKHKGNIAWVVKSAGPCGGMFFIADLVNELIEQGYNAKICVVPDNYDEEHPPQLSVVGNLRTGPYLFKSHEEFTSTFTERVFKEGKVFAAVTEMTPLVWDLDQRYKGIEGYNHVQSYDPELALSVGRQDLIPGIVESYKRLPNMVSSKWVSEQIQQDGGDVHGVILPGVNSDLFHPRNRERGDERFTVAVMMNDAYNFKGTEWARDMLKRLKPHTRNIRVLAIGPKSVNIQGVTCLGGISQAKMAELLGSEVDVLVDPADVQSYGLPALEALNSGCRVIARDNRGIREYEKLWNGRVDLYQLTSEAAERIIELRDAPLFGSTEEREAATSPAHDRKEAVKRFIDFVFPPVHMNSHRIEVVTPHLRKHGGPTTIISAAKQLQALGHDTSLSMVYTDWNPEVLSMAKHLNVRTTWKAVPDDVEAVIINSDNPFAKTIMENHPDKKFIMLKLSHNPRFKRIENDNLDLPWDHIITSTAWLRNVCMHPEEGWTHRAWDRNQVTVVGWYHYGHDLFNMPPTNRTYGNAEVGFRVGTLIHAHPLKGSREALASIDGLKRKYEALIHAAGFGECKAQIPWHMQYFRNAGRKDMAHAFKQLDVWLGASHSEGLGRIALEAMSAGVAVVTTDTGAEYLRDGENCLLYEVNSPQAGAEAIDRLVNDKELFTKIILGGHRTAMQAADPTDFGENLDKVIRLVMRSA